MVRKAGCSIKNMNCRELYGTPVGRRPRVMARNHQVLLSGAGTAARDSLCRDGGDPGPEGRGAAGRPHPALVLPGEVGGPGPRTASWRRPARCPRQRGCRRTGTAHRPGQRTGPRPRPMPPWRTCGGTARPRPGRGWGRGFWTGRRPGHRGPCHRRDAAPPSTAACAAGARAQRGVRSRQAGTQLVVAMPVPRCGSQCEPGCERLLEPLLLRRRPVRHGRERPSQERGIKPFVVVRHPIGIRITASQTSWYWPGVV